jgi:hypothetical protein
VVECGFGGGIFPGGEEAFAVVGAHGRREADGVGGGQGVFEKKSGLISENLGACGDGGEGLSLRGVRWGACCACLATPGDDASGFCEAPGCIGQG